MRLLIIANDFPSKHDDYTGLIFVKEQVKELAKLVDEINVLIPIPRGIELYRRRIYGVKSIKYENYTIRSNVNVYFVKYMNPLFPLAFRHFKKEWILLESRALYSFIVKNNIKFDMIHAHYTWPSGAVAVSLKKKFNTPVVITEHSSITFRTAVERKDPVFIKAWRIADAIIRVRKGDIELFNRAGIPLEKVYYIPNGYSAEKFKKFDKLECRKKLGLPDDARIVLNVGNLYSEVKGHKYLIEAMRIVANEVPNVLCIIIGDGVLRKELEELVGKLNLENNIKLVGAKPHDEVPVWMSASDIFVIPSIIEGNPTVMFEALGVGLPVIATRVGGIPEIISSEEYGFLCEPANPNDLAKKILLALERNWNREKIQSYAEQFTWENIARKTLSVYEDILASLKAERFRTIGFYMV